MFLTVFEKMLKSEKIIGCLNVTFSVFSEISVFYVFEIIFRKMKRAIFALVFVLGGGGFGAKFVFLTEIGGFWRWFWMVIFEMGISHRYLIRGGGLFEGVLDGPEKALRRP